MYSRKMHCLTKSAAFCFLCLQGEELAKERNTGFLAKVHPIWVCSWAELSAPWAMATAQRLPEDMFAMFALAVTSQPVW